MTGLGRGAARVAALLAAPLLGAMAAGGAVADDEAEARALFGDIDDRALKYEFRVEGSRVGLGHGRIVKTGDAEWRVEIAYEIDVDLLGVDVYDLDLEATEIYRGARLVSLKSEAVEDGARHRIEGEAEGDRFHFTHNGEKGEAAADVVPSTQLWRKRLLKRTRALHVIEGKLFDRTAEPTGESEIETPSGASLTVEGVHIETPFETADLWYDAEGLLQRAKVERMGTTLLIRRLEAEGE